MRATMSGYYRNLNYDQNKVVKELFDVNKQISSGTKIQYAHEDVSTFVDAVRLDNEVTTLTQVKQNALKALQFSTNTDTTMNDMTKILDAMKVKLVAASSDSNSPESLNALSAELRGLEKNLVQLANTSIDGKYLFSGSEVKTKPIDANGIYQGNDKDIQAFLGSGVAQTYNINGADLFLGGENNTQRKITLNVPHLNQTLLYPDVMQDPTLSRNTRKEEYITQNDSIRDLMGDTDENIDLGNAKHNFYLKGTKHDGTNFKQTVSMSDEETVSDLMKKIGAAYGNTPSNEVVSVTINNHGQIEIEDKRSGSSKLDFHMVANTGAVVTDINNLNTNNTKVTSFVRSNYTEFVSNLEQRQDIYDNDNFTLAGNYTTQAGKIAIGSTLLSDVLRADVVNPGSIVFGGVDSSGAGVASSFDVSATSTMQDLLTAINGTYDANVSGATNGDLSFSLKNGQIVFSRENGFAGAIDIKLEAHDANGGGGAIVDGLPSDAAVAFDESQFLKEGSFLNSNVSQISKIDNSYASDATKLVDVSSVPSLVGAPSLDLAGTTTGGQVFNASFDFTSPVTYTMNVAGVASGPFNVYNADAARTNTAPDDVTYKQLMDVVNLAVTGTVPAGNTAVANDAALKTASSIANVSLNEQGQMTIQDINATTTQAQFKITDTNSNIMPVPPAVLNGSILSFQSNNALEISDPKTNFFKQIDEAITTVEQGRKRADGNVGDPRSVGMQNAIQFIDDLSNHLFNQHSKAGVQSQTLQTTSDRTDLLIITTKTLRSDTLDVDIADASLNLQQLTLNYQAMLSTVSKVTQLSLVNYL